MSDHQKKQFSLGLTVKIFLAAMILISIGVFANSIMHYNQLNNEIEELEQSLAALYETRTELVEMMGSTDEVNELLSDYRRCKDLIESGAVEGEILDEYIKKMENIRTMLNSSKNKDYIARIAKEELNLYFADEEIFYNERK